MPDHDDSPTVPLAAFGELSNVHEAETVTETVEVVAEFAVQTLGCTGAAILLGKTAVQLELAVATDESIIGLVQPAVGPVRDAFNSATAIIIDEITSGDRWPDWPPADPKQQSLLALRLRIGGQPGGVLVAGHTDPAAFGEDEEAIAHIIARHASIAVAGARQQATLAEAADARKLVGQAMGILMERYQINDDQAFAILRRYSQDTNTKLRTIAIQLIETRTLPGLARQPAKAR